MPSGDFSPKTVKNGPQPCIFYFFLPLFSVFWLFQPFPAPFFVSNRGSVFHKPCKNWPLSRELHAGDGIPLPDFGASQLLAGSSRVWLKGLRLKLRQERNICSRQTAKHLKLRQERHVPLLTELEPIPVAQLQ